MVELDISGIKVQFPFQPYDSQLLYMEKVIESLNGKQNAILESPTGTGKTLCLLCATLGWQQHIKQKIASGQPVPGITDRKPANKGEIGYEDVPAEGEEERSLIPRIIYSSRTHSQLKQVVQELKNTSYRPKSAVLGSREHLCVHEKISNMKGTQQNMACRQATKKRTCEFKRGFDKIKKQDEQKSQPIMDIEELVDKMKAKKVCPFFLCRHIIPDAEILFVPYNYLIDPLARRSIGISLENSVLIFDEAHNVESVASDAASYTLSSSDIAGCVAEVEQFMNKLSNGRLSVSATSKLTSETVGTLRALLLEIDKGLHSFPLSSTGGFTKPGAYIFEFFQQFNVNFETCPLVLSIVEEIVEVSNNENENKNASKLDTLVDFLGTVFRNKKNHIQAANKYRVHIQESTVATQHTGSFSTKKQKTRVFNYWCFDPGVAFREICENQVYNLVLTSGTLSPLETTAKELGIPFPIRLENNHVVDTSQVWCGVVGTGVTGQRLNSSYNFRSTETYLLELGNTIVNFTRLVPKGLLVFFPSYTILEQTVERWQRRGVNESEMSIWDRIQQHKDTFTEPRGRVEFQQTVSDYENAIQRRQGGAVFFAVCRGKVSEGIDFSNDKGRAVVITGLPFAPTKDPGVILKKHVLDEAHVSPGDYKLTGNHWYVQQASRAVNQAVGRVIRHRHDYGAIILLDERFALDQQQKTLSKWLQPYCRVCRKYGEAHIGLTRFFKKNGSKQPSLNVPVVAPRSTGLSKCDISLSQASSVSSTRESIGGDGQTYVNPSLLQTNATESKPSAIAQLMQMKSSVPEKKSLGSVLSSGPMVTSTSSLVKRSEPSTDMTRSRNKSDTPTKTKASSSNGNTMAEKFPKVARQVLQEDEVTSLYALIRKLHDKSDVDASIDSLCELLSAVKCQPLRSLVPQVLGRSDISKKFVDSVKAKGLEIATSGQTGLYDVFGRLQMQKRKRGRGDEQATIVDDPQCFVCFQLVRKAFASHCGHICCLQCWKTMEKDGYTSCPVCKHPIKMDELHRIKAAKKAKDASSAGA